MTNFLELALASDRAVRFAFCAPRRLNEHFAPPPPMCDGVHFDLLRHITFEGLPSLRATRRAWNAVQRMPAKRAYVHTGEWHDPQRRLAVYRKPTCKGVIAALRSNFSTVLIHLAPNKHVLDCLRSRAGVKKICPKTAPPSCADMKDDSSPCLRLIRPHPRLLVRHEIPPCDEGLHLRSLSIDAAHCSIENTCNSGSSTNRDVPPKDLELCNAPPGSKRVPMPQSISRCSSGRRFATSDSPALYTQLTRPRGFVDLNETAAASKYGSQDYTDSGLMEKTVLAWLTLTRCRRAIVSPVPSAFSRSAAIVAQVPLLFCCGEPGGSRAGSYFALRASTPLTLDALGN